MKLLTNRKERLIRMEEPCVVSKREKMVFLIVAFLLCWLLPPFLCRPSLKRHILLHVMVVRAY
ncbi:MAG: sodium ion-translocating decarboxylase subunit beta [Desulfobacteraceae bacterium]|nr:sodium ion-translocating decarboxylase subunit beta [Desulfobacteraceae bacterium]